MGVAADIAEIKKADIDYQIAQNFYDGRHIKEVFSNPTTAALLGKNAAAYMVNIARRGVDAVMDKLVVTGWKITRDGDADEDYEDAFRDNVWDHNTLKQLIPDALLAAEVQGDAYLLAWCLSSLNEFSGALLYVELALRLLKGSDTARLISFNII